MTEKGTEHIDELYVLTHPAYELTLLGSCTEELCDETRALLKATQTLLEKVATVHRTALLILQPIGAEEFLECTRGEYGPDYAFWAATMLQIHDAFRNRAHTIFNAIIPDEKDPDIARETFAERGYTVDEQTQLFGIGEMQAACVTAAMRHFGKALGSTKKPVIDLAYTNIYRKPPEERRHWMEGGALLRMTKADFPDLGFLPLRDTL